MNEESDAPAPPPAVAEPVPASGRGTRAGAAIIAGLIVLSLTL